MTWTNKKERKEKTSIWANVVNIATIVSASVTCIRLTYYHILSIQIAALILIAVTLFVALGNDIGKVLIAGASLFLFILLYSYGDKHQFTMLFGAMLSLIIALCGIYIMLKGLFGK